MNPTSYHRLSRILIFLIPVLIILFVVAVNRFPEGYTFGGGDTNQLLNIKDSLKDFYYIWNDRLASAGEGGFFSWFSSLPYYFLFYYVPAIFGLNNTQSLSFILFLFLTFSHLSFWYCLRLVFGDKLNPFLRSGFSLLYALNFTTLYFFTYTWGFTHQVLLYLFLPILTGYFLKFMEEKSLLRLFQLSFFLILASISFVNAAFLFSLIIYLLLLFFLLIVLRFCLLDWHLVKLSLAALILVFVGWFYWLLPTLFFVQEKFTDLISHEVFDLKGWLSMQAVSVFNIYDNVSSYLPLQDYWSLPFLPLGLILLTLIWYKKVDLREKKLVASLSSIFVLFVFFLKKTDPPFSWLTLKLMSTPFLAPLRSYEKVAIFTPLLILLNLSILLPAVIWRRSHFLSFVLIFLMLLSPLPFWSGGILSNYSGSFGGKSDFREAYFSFLEKVPADYYQMADFVNRDSGNGKIQAAPFAVINSITWVNYPKWQHTGIDPTTSLFQKNIVSQISSFYPLNELWLKDEWSPDWYLTFLSHFGVDSILFHKDERIDFVNQGLPKIEILEKEGKLHRTKETENLILTRLDDRYLLPALYVPDRIYLADLTQTDLPRFFSASGYSPGEAFFFSKGLRAEQINRLKKIFNPPVWQKIGPSPADCTACYVLKGNLEPSSNLYIAGVPQTSRTILDGKAIFPNLEKSPKNILFFSLNSLAKGTDRRLEVQAAPENLIKIRNLETFDPKILAQRTININSNKFNDLVNSLLPFRDENFFSLSLGDWNEFSSYKFSFDYPTSYPTILFLLLENQQLTVEGHKAALTGQTEQRETITQVDDLASVQSGRPSVLDDTTNSGRLSPVLKGYSHYETSLVPGSGAKSARALFYFYNPAEATAAAQALINFKQEKIFKTAVYTSNSGGPRVNDIPVKLKLIKINPTQYRVRVSNPSGSNFLLVLNESFHQWWKVFPSAKDNFWAGLSLKETYKNGAYEDYGNLSKISVSSPAKIISAAYLPENQHFLANGFANSWLVTPETAAGAKEYDLTIEFVPQEYFYWSVFLSLAALIFCAVNIFRYLKK